MTIKTCDCCGKQTDNLVTLYEKYRVSEVSEICAECEGEINEQLAKINKTIVILKHNFITKFIENLKAKNMIKLLPLLLLALTGCDFMHDHFAIPDHRYKGTVILHVIRKGENKSTERSPSIVNGDGVKFNFNFQEVALPKDSAIQKLYGLSDSWSHHLKYSARFGFRIRQDSTIDIFSYVRHKGDFYTQWLGNVRLYDWHYAAVEIEDSFYEFRLDEKVYRIPFNTRDRWWDFRYRNFMYWEGEKGEGAPGRISVAIEEI